MLPLITATVIIAQAPQQGSTIQLNGQPTTGRWLTRSGEIYVEANWLVENLGMNLLPSPSPTQQRLKWFSSPLFANLLTVQARPFVAITPWQSQWRIATTSQTLSLTIPPRQITALRLAPKGERLVIELNAPAPFQVTRQVTGQDGKTLLTVNAVLADPLRTIKPTGMKITQKGKQTTFLLDTSLIASDTQDNPKRIVLDLTSNPNIKPSLTPPSSPDNSASINPTPYTGIRLINQISDDRQWQIYALEVDLTQINMRPLWSNPAAMTGTSPLTTIVPLWQALGAINGGFFNRERQQPVGAIRRDGQWIAGAALTRGTVAWNDRGEVFMDRLSYAEELEANGVKINLTNLNSGFVQKGMARYTPAWGEQYVTLTDNEVLVQVQNNQVIGQFQGRMAGQSQLPIPKDGYILVLRNAPELLSLITIGSPVAIRASLSPVKFNDLPHLVSAGPLLLQQGQVVVNPIAEGFSATFAQQRAVRSAIATTAKPKQILLVAIYGADQLPTLTETAQILKELGAIDALNLDGGSSTAIYLGNRLITPPSTVPIHNAIGLFPRPPAPAP